MWRIGAILFTLGLILISPVDEILILVPLSAVVGIWVFPLAIMIALVFLFVGGVLIGRHIIPLIKNPIILLCIVASVVVLVYMIWSSGWLTEYLKYI